MMDIMTVLFDQEEVTRSLIASKEARAMEKGLKQGIEQGIEKGIEKGAKSSKLDALKKVMNKFHISMQEAMDTLEIPVSERNEYIRLLEASK